VDEIAFHKTLQVMDWGGLGKAAWMEQETYWKYLMSYEFLHFHSE
jgi:hypothetical protein